jgi:uncharacterized protein (UPF0548 family)
VQRVPYQPSFGLSESLFVYYLKVLLFSPPSEAQLNKFLAGAAHSQHSYTEVGATLDGAIPKSYVVDHNRVLLGKGEAQFHRAALAIRDWKMFDLGWVRVYPAAAPIRMGENVAIVARWFNLYFVNACRIVDTIHEHVPVPRYGFVYGTLHDHAESGEERFVVEHDRYTDEVWYDLLAFSRPNQLLARIGYPFARGLQKRFAADSKAAMARAVKG